MYSSKLENISESKSVLSLSLSPHHSASKGQILAHKQPAHEICNISETLVTSSGRPQVEKAAVLQASVRASQETIPPTSQSTQKHFRKMNNFQFNWSFQFTYRVKVCLALAATAFSQFSKFLVFLKTA